MKTVILKLDYDAEADAAYIRLGTGRHHDSEEVAPGVVLDFDEENKVVGLEVLRASKTLGPGLIDEEGVDGRIAEGASA